METGAGRPAERVYKHLFYPDAKAQSWAWMLFQHGMAGCHYWAFNSGEEYSAKDWDGGVCDFTINASLMNQNYRVYGNLLSTLKPVRDIAYYYPYATFMHGKQDEVDLYQLQYNMLTARGYQVKIFSAFTPEVLNECRYAIIPPAPYLERAIVPKLEAFVKRGGTLIVTGATGRFDEHARAFTADNRGALADLLGANLAGQLTSEGGKLQLGTQSIAFVGNQGWGTVTPTTARPLAAYDNGQVGATAHQLGKGCAICIPSNLGSSFGQGVSLIDFTGPWKFKFGDSWPQGPGTTETSLQGHTDAGTAGKWFDPDFDDSSWGTINAPGVWEENGYPNTDGWGWYRRAFTLPAGMQGKRIFLTGYSLDDRARVYMNGHLVAEPNGWNARFQVDVSPYVHVTGRNVVALRIEDNCFLGGIRGFVSLVTPDVPKADEMVLNTVLTQLGKQPETASSNTDVFRTLMRDPQGKRYLLVATTKNETLHAVITLPATTVSAKGGTVMDLFTGRTFAAKQQGKDFSIELTVKPCDELFIPLGTVNTTVLPARISYVNATATAVTPTTTQTNATTPTAAAMLLQVPGKSPVELQQFANKAADVKEAGTLQATFTAITLQALQQKGLVKADGTLKPGFRIVGEITKFSVENRNEIIPFVNRWRKITTATVTAHVKVINLAANAVLLDTEESAVQVHQGKEQVDFTVGKEANPEPGIDTIDFGTAFPDSLIGQCAAETATKLAEKIRKAL